MPPPIPECPTAAAPAPTDAEDKLRPRIRVSVLFQGDRERLYVPQLSLNSPLTGGKGNQGEDRKEAKVAAEKRSACGRGAGGEKRSYERRERVAIAAPAFLFAFPAQRDDAGLGPLPFGRIQR